MKKFLKILIFSTFFGSSFVIFNIGGISINLFRLCFIIFTVFHIITCRNNKNNHSNKSNYLVLTTFFLFITLFTILLTPNIKQWFNGTISVIMNILLIYYINFYSDSEESLKEYIKYYIYGILMTCVVSLYEYITGIHVISSTYLSEFAHNTYEYAELKKAPTAFLYNPNNIAVSILLAIPFIKIISKNKIINIIYIILVLTVTMMTGSRGGILTGIVSIILIYMLNKNKPVKKIGSFVLLTLLCWLLIVVNSNFILKQLKYSGLNIDNISLEQINDKSRKEIIKKGFIVAKENWFMGYGPYGAESATLEYYGKAVSIHMFWVECIVDFGIFGAICIYYFYIKCLMSMWKLRKKDEVANCILISLIIFMPLSTIPPTIFTLYNVWIIFGFAVATKKLNKGGIQDNENSNAY